MRHHVCPRIVRECAPRFETASNFKTICLTLSSTPSLMDPSASSSTQDPTAVLRNANFSHADGSAPVDSVTAADVLLGSYDPTKLHPLAAIEDKLDYLLLEDDKTSDLPGSGTAIPSRGWSDDLCYGTGTMYLSGACPAMPRCSPSLLSQLVFFHALGSHSMPSLTGPLIVFATSHADRSFSQVSPWVVCGACVKAREDP